jgi:hypothetical protein
MGKRGKKHGSTLIKGSSFASRASLFLCLGCARPARRGPGIHSASSIPPTGAEGTKIARRRSARSARIVDFFHCWYWQSSMLSRRLNSSWAEQADPRWQSSVNESWSRDWTTKTNKLVDSSTAIPQQALESSGMGFITLSLEIFLTPGRFARVFRGRRRPNKRASTV